MYITNSSVEKHFYHQLNSLFSSLIRFIGMAGDGELRLKTSRVLSVRSAFYPFIGAKIQDSESFAEKYINDYRDGSIVTVRCYHIARDFDT